MQEKALGQTSLSLSLSALPTFHPNLLLLPACLLSSSSHTFPPRLSETHLGIKERRSLHNLLQAGMGQWCNHKPGSVQKQGWVPRRPGLLRSPRARKSTPKKKTQDSRLRFQDALSPFSSKAKRADLGHMSLLTAGLSGWAWKALEAP